MFQNLIRAWIKARVLISGTGSMWIARTFMKVKISKYILLDFLFSCTHRWPVQSTPVLKWFYKSNSGRFVSFGYLKASESNFLQVWHLNITVYNDCLAWGIQYPDNVNFGTVVPLPKCLHLLWQLFIIRVESGCLLAIRIGYIRSYSFVALVILEFHLDPKKMLKFFINVGISLPVGFCKYAITLLRAGSCIILIRYFFVNILCSGCFFERFHLPINFKMKTVALHNLLKSDLFIDGNHWLLKFFDSIFIVLTDMIFLKRRNCCVNSKHFIQISFHIGEFNYTWTHLRVGFFKVQYFFQHLFRTNCIFGDYGRIIIIHSITGFSFNGCNLIIIQKMLYVSERRNSVWSQPSWAVHTFNTSCLFHLLENIHSKIPCTFTRLFCSL